ncbi:MULTISPECIES: hypothetical protein [Pseudomonas putida group]|uniref:hypothetical protein n=1 Tax=Pseudomonas putida group TaxID=136845 RepID=UPI001E296A84|nr:MULTISPECIES: hypothetical protein [Pseudomonas putida group]MCE1010101.1 hypothetical protein [Pseudomonas monteilii]MCE1056019.1 hypothetical protein [Pseudomonas alloputida]
MNQKLTSDLRREIKTLALKKYTAAMIQHWVRDQYGLKVAQTTISRAISKSFRENTCPTIFVPGENYKYYREKVDIGKPLRKYSRHLDSYLGIIEKYFYEQKLSHRKIRKLLKDDHNITTSDCSVRRALEKIYEENKKGQESKSIRESLDSISRIEQSPIQL